MPDKPPQKIWIQNDFSFFQATGNGTYYRDPDKNSIPYVLESRVVPPADESPIFAFEKWLLRWVEDNGRKLNQTEYGIAYAAFIAAHPGQGPQAHVMDTAPLADAVEKCVWELDDVMDGDVWETNCGQTFQFTDGGPEDNQFKFCYKCGKPIEVCRKERDDEDDE